MQPVTAAVVQMNSGDDLSRNLERAGTLIEHAAKRGAGLVVLPENFAFMGGEGEKAKVAESRERPGAILQALSRWASANNVTVVAGGFPEASVDAQRPYNCSLVVDEMGSIVAQYRKIHLFDVDLPDGTRLCESASTSGGDEVVTVALKTCRLGLSICYDVRFSELYRELARRGADVVTVPAAFTLTTGRDHWHLLLRARAIESELFVLAAAQWGTHPGQRHTYGHALIVDPWGTVLAECADGEGIAVAELDPTRLEQVRRSLPVGRHHKL